MNWSRQGGAVVSSVRLTDGRAAKVVLVSGRENPKGAMLVLADAGTAQNAFPINSLLNLLPPDAATDILCMQERAFNSKMLTPPNLS